MIPNATPPRAIALPDRGQIRVEGKDARDFLQRLLTQDMGALAFKPLIYSSLLTAQGKFAHDMFIRQQDDVFFIDCESGARAQDLAKTLTMYRLRSDVGLSVTEDIRVYAVFGAAEGLPDPRHDALGNRLYQDAPDALDMGGFDDYDRLRIRLALPDGSRDGVVGESTLAELNISELAVSYTKGCFIGQELTARLHNMGHAKKHLYPLKLNGPAPAFQAEIIDINGHYIGHMRSSNGDLGLACIKDDSLQSIPPALGEILS